MQMSCIHHLLLHAYLSIYPCLLLDAYLSIYPSIYAYNHNIHMNVSAWTLVSTDAYLHTCSRCRCPAYTIYFHMHIYLSFHLSMLTIAISTWMYLHGNWYPQMLTCTHVLVAGVLHTLFTFTWISIYLSIYLCLQSQYPHECICMEIGIFLWSCLCLRPYLLFCLRRSRAWDFKASLGAFRIWSP
jgi:hypothetical protein